MIPLGNMGTFSALKLSEATRVTSEDMLASRPADARLIKAFEDRVTSISSPKDLIADQEVYTFVMRAFDLDDRIFGKAMNRKILEGDIQDRESLVNRLNDPKFREMHQVLGFAPGGGGSENFGDPVWRSEMVDRFIDTSYVNAVAEMNEGAGLALGLIEKAGEIESWFDILADRDLSTVMRTALGLPSEMVRLDIDRQAELFAAKFDLKKFAGPEEVDKLARRFAAIYDATTGAAGAGRGSAALALLTGGASSGFAPILESITTISRNGYVR